MAETTSFGTWLRLRRRSLDLTREVLAAIVGCAPVTLKKIEADERKPSAQLAERLATALQVNDEERSVFLRSARTGLIEPTRHAPVLPLATRAPATSVRIPIPPTPLIGRRRELARLRRSLTTPHIRLMTIIGPPGVGKTRLAIAVAQAGFLPRRSIFVALAACQLPDQIAPTIAQALGLRLDTRQSLIEQLQVALQHTPTLLIVDNVEHVLEGVPLLAELLACVEDLRILATSRVRLRIRGEHVFRLESLGLPPLPEKGGKRSGRLSDSERLFLHLARAVDPEFYIQDANAEHIAVICRQINGLPLALELAASRLADYDLATIRFALQERLNILSEGPRDLPERQQTLEAAFDWSYALLAPEVQQIYRACSILVSTFDSPLAATISGIGSPAEARNMLDTLVEASLLNQVDSAYAFLESLRLYSRMRLELAAEQHDVEQRLLDWALQLVAAARPGVAGSDQAEWFERLDRAIAHLRVALGIAHQATNKQALLDLAAGLYRYWQSRGLYTEGLHWLRLGLALTQPAADRTLTYAYHVAGTIAQELGHLDEALHFQSMGLDLVRRIDQPRLYAEVLNNLALTHMRRGDYQQATELLHDAIAIAQSIEHFHVIGHAHNNLGLISLGNGDHACSEAHFMVAIEAFQRQQDWRGCAFPLNNWAELAVLIRDNNLAELLLREALALWNTFGDSWGICYVYLSQGWLCLNRGQWLQASKSLRLALERFVDMNDQRNTLRCCDAIAVLALRLGNAMHACAIWNATATIRADLGFPLPPGEQLRLKPLQRQAEALAPSTDRTAFQSQKMTLLELIARARRTLDCV